MASCVYHCGKTLSALEQKESDVVHMQCVNLYLPDIRLPLAHNKTVRGHLSLYHYQ